MRIDVENITYAYNGKAALRGVSATIGEGQMVGILGANGSGKSTLLKCISGVLKAQRGKVLVDGEPLDKRRNIGHAQRIAYVAQDEEDAGQMSVADYMLLGRKPYVRGWGEREEDVATVLDVAARLGIADKVLRRMEALSGGERQMVRIGRALSQTPEVIAMDEPTSNLDVNRRNRIMHVLRELVKDKITVVMTLHDVNMAFDYFEDIIMIKEGRVERRGGRELAREDVLSALYGSAMSVREVDGELMIKDRRI